MADISKVKLPDNTEYDLKDANAVHSVKTVNGETISGTGDVKTAYYVTITGNDTDGYTADKTFDEVKAAYDAGHTVLLMNGNNCYVPTQIGGTSAMVFSRATATTITNFRWAKVSGLSKSTQTLSDLNTTYGISISGNVITLTGSDSSTSSVTLPVYNGGVST